MAEQTMKNPQLAAIEIEELSRGSMIMKGALAAGALYGTMAVGPLVRSAFAQGSNSDGDIEILNFALTLEYLEAAFYEQALAEVPDLSGEVSDLAKEIQGHEQEHVDALTAAIKDLGGKPVAAPGVDFGKAFADEDAFLELAQTFEDTGVSAYNGAGPLITDKAILGSAGAIVQIEARHAAAIRLQRGESPAPEAFDMELSMDEVLKAVEPFVKN
ncbi:MAG: ferritin-like domain-containing protein [Solirubrobacterales bacterium]